MGPQAAILLLVALALPWTAAPGRRGLACLLAVQVWFQLLFWFVVPYAN